MVAGSGKLPPSSPVTTTLPPLAERAGGERQRLVRADEIAGREHAAAGGLQQRAARLAIGRIEGRGGAGLERGLALAGVDVGDDRRLREQRARDRQPHHADAAEPDQQRRPARGVRARAA